MSRHPKERTLRAWARGDHDDLTGHISNCAQCLADLEALTQLDPQFRRALAALVRPRSGLLERIESGIEERRRRNEALGIFGDLFTLSFRTIDLMIEEDDD